MHERIILNQRLERNVKTKSYRPRAVRPRKLLGLFKRITDAERKKLFRWLYKLVGPCQHASLLELGGPTETFSEVAKTFDSVIVVNLLPKYGVEMVRADARNLPFVNKVFDYVFSNAMLEHIPKSDWPAVANEIIRVSVKGFFITTPNYWFPFEPHYLLPFFQYLPESIKHFFLFRIGIKIGGMNKKNYHIITLPRKNQLKELFPDANFNGFGTLVPRHLVVWYKFK
jgi:hypothetical protein